MFSKIQWLLGCSLIVFLSLSYGCNTTSSGGEGAWLIPESQVKDGGPGKDGIPSVDNPRFAPVDQIGYIVDDRMVIGVKKGDEVKAYPHQIMDWHEIVNDEIGGVPLALTYCPLTNTGIGWHREVDGEVAEFGVSGLLFRNNLIPYDRNTDSKWSQMQLRGVNGIRAGTNIDRIDVVETNWSTWKKMYPNSKVLTTDTGFSRNYSGYAYGQSYLNNQNTLFPAVHEDDRLHPKERVHGVIADSVADEDAPAKAYVISRMSDSVSVIQDSFNGIDHVVVGSAGLNFAASFKRTIDQTTLTFEAVQDSLPVVMKDREGNRWNVFGEAVSGSRQGQQLTPTRSYTGYWLAWADFFPGLKIHTEAAK